MDMIGNFIPTATNQTKLMVVKSDKNHWRLKQTQLINQKPEKNHEYLWIFSQPIFVCILCRIQWCWRMKSGSIVGRWKGLWKRRWTRRRWEGLDGGGVNLWVEEKQGERQNKRSTDREEIQRKRWFTVSEYLRRWLWAAPRSFIWTCSGVRR